MQITNLFNITYSHNGSTAQIFSLYTPKRPSPYLRGTFPVITPKNCPAGISLVC